MVTAVALMNDHHCCKSPGDFVSMAADLLRASCSGKAHYPHSRCNRAHSRCMENCVYPMKAVKPFFFCEANRKLLCVMRVCKNDNMPVSHRPSCGNKPDENVGLAQITHQLTHKLTLGCLKTDVTR